MRCWGRLWAILLLFLGLVYLFFSCFCFVLVVSPPLPLLSVSVSLPACFVATNFGTPCLLGNECTLVFIPGSVSSVGLLIYLQWEKKRSKYVWLVASRACYLSVLLGEMVIVRGISGPWPTALSVVD